MTMSEPFEGIIRDEAGLREIIPPPHPRARDKQIDHLDENCRQFIAHAPFVLLGTTNPDGTGDVSPKGGPPGFVRVLDRHRLALGELPGNGRVDSFRNLLANPAIRLIKIEPTIVVGVEPRGAEARERPADGAKAGGSGRVAEERAVVSVERI